MPAGIAIAKYWTQPFRDGARVLTFDEAMARFRDATGRPGAGHLGAGQLSSTARTDFPVGGISWFEAAAPTRSSSASG